MTGVRAVVLAVTAAALLLSACGPVEESAIGSATIDRGQTQNPIDTQAQTEPRTQTGDRGPVHTIRSQLVLPNGEVVAEVPSFISGDSAPWNSPAGMIAAMLAPIPIRQPPGMTIESVSLVSESDFQGNRLVTIEVHAVADFTVDEVRVLLHQYPMYPRDLTTIPLPKGAFEAWDLSTPMSYNPDQTPIRTTARVRLSTLGPTDEPLPSTALADPLRGLLESFPPGVGSPVGVDLATGRRECTLGKTMARHRPARPACGGPIDRRNGHPRSHTSFKATGSRPT